MQTDCPEKLSHMTIALHWIVGISFIGMLVLGLVMEDFKDLGLVPIHKSIGMLLLAFVVVRVLWRIKNGWPKPVNQYKAYELLLSKAVHWVLILGTLALPLSGLLMSYMSGNNVAFFGLELVGRNLDPADLTNKLARNESLAHFGHEAHEIGANVMIAAIALHIAGALKHHLVDKDGTLMRMRGKTVQVKS